MLGNAVKCKLAPRARMLGLCSLDAATQGTTAAARSSIRARCAPLRLCGTGALGGAQRKVQIATGKLPSSIRRDGLSTTTATAASV
ncbi:hypothetical protein CYMTET_35208, partial [Cymbomonas tetramitiformis]